MGVEYTSTVNAYNPVEYKRFHPGSRDVGTARAAGRDEQVT